MLGGFWWVYVRDDNKEDETTPSATAPSATAPSSTAPSSPAPYVVPPFKPSARGIVPTKSFLGYYSGLLESNWGDGNVDSCRAYADNYNSTNPTDPYVAYAARGAGNTSLPGTCIYWRQNFQNTYPGAVVRTAIDPSSKERVVMKCMDPDAYPDNQCLSVPYGSVTSSSTNS